MERNKILTLAKQAGMAGLASTVVCEIAELERFAEFVIADEREACAQLAEAAAQKIGDLGRQHRDDGNEDSMDRCYAMALQCTRLAADIRTRSNASYPSRMTE